MIPSGKAPKSELPPTRIIDAQSLFTKQDTPKLTKGVNFNVWCKYISDAASASTKTLAWKPGYPGIGVSAFIIELQGILGLIPNRIARNPQAACDSCSGIKEQCQTRTN